MKCPRCGSEMSVASHRKYPVRMCYNCGYTEGQKYEKEGEHTTNFEHMKTMNFNEMAIYISEGLGLDMDKVMDWMDDMSD